ncbi:UDP-N-acetylglucosamine 2-epimerase (non-hydrolyzing) [Euzebyella marina]|uniref:UDP-N-acetylglucosamine 2-epimerase (Non-hydrolyzing) n=1 Tax=Euzebyella marina TaxID=1761453 RepID=A0A3G2L1G2_9FLAO|nr:UDP-N-acetylglucosamine 2-epimerase (non-hydrolyzing) [Euzebyella marina]AYN66089.1 UDP-N-acetylglucosamine 2-epimerase (non-hydrolyzing) [Euzebyella marina]
MKIVTVIGARPQFIKASSLSREIGKRQGIDEVIVHTGQHFDKNMSHIFFEEMKIPEPRYNLNINSLNHGAMTGRMLEEIESIMLKETPDWLVVYGDTNSTISGALAAKKLHIKVAHVEAGLRSFDMRMPEEVNRILTDQISDILFCPTEVAVKNLEAEGFGGKKVKISLSGDIMFDSALYYRQKMKRPEGIDPNQTPILVTIHRQENTDDLQRLKNILDALNGLAKEGEKLIWPIHPRTRKIIEKQGWTIDFDCIAPVGYLEMLYLLEKCSMVITDSGGLQKEAYFFNKYCLTLRDSTEWVELVENDVNSLINVTEPQLKERLRAYLNQKIDNSNYLYGKGQSAAHILDDLVNYSKE